MTASIGHCSRSSGAWASSRAAPTDPVVHEGAAGGQTAEARTRWSNRISNFIGTEVCDEIADRATYIPAEAQKAAPWVTRKPRVSSLRQSQ